MYKIAIIIPYFGKLPFWIDFFLKSCSANQNYTWYIYSDSFANKKTPENVIIRNTTFEKYNNLVSDRLGINFNPTSPYKLCDIKPALGYIHKEELTSYDFIGFGDLDLIYGNLNTFFTEQKLNKYDIISTHSRRISGHLCILRNNLSTLSAYKQVKNWKKFLSDPEHQHFDEKLFSDLFVKHKNFPEWLRRITNKFYPLTRRVSFEESFSTPFMKIPWIKGKPKPTIWYWKSGKLFTDSDESLELAYFHFLYWKKQCWHDKCENNLIAIEELDNYTSFTISKNGFKV